MKYRSLRVSVQRALVAFLAVLLCAALGILLLGNRQFSAVYQSLEDQGGLSDYFEELATLQEGLLDQVAGTSEEARAESRALLADLLSLAQRLAQHIEDPRFTDLAYMTRSYAGAVRDYLSEGERTGAGPVALYQGLAHMNTLLQARYAPLTRIKEAYTLTQTTRFAQTWQMRTVGVIAGLTALGLALFAAGTAFIQRTIAPLTALTDYARRMGAGERAPLPDPDTQTLPNNEVGVLTGAVRQMAETIRRQMESLEDKIAVDERLHSLELENMQIQVSLKETELLFQQALINPHFLFNCLNTLSGLAYLEGAPDTRKAANLIALFLRQALARVGRSVTLDEELDHVRLYTRIQALRFGERIAFSVSVQPEAAGAVMPAMLVQPLVENAVNHGVGGYLDGGAVAVTADLVDGKVRITVTDNGVGIAEEAQAQLLASLDEPVRHGEALGLRSVAHRLRAVYGADAEVALESVPGRTAVTLRFPYRTHDN